MTKIEWANPPGYKGESWNPVTGCTPISPGCENCWARRMAYRQRGRNGYPMDDPFCPATVHENKMGAPSHWMKPRCVFVCSMGDLFHDDVPDARIQEVLSIVDWNKHHRFLLLTKRPERMRDVLRERYGNEANRENLAGGVSVESNAQFHRVTTLLECQLAMRFVSVEPMLGPVTVLPFLPSPADAQIFATLDRYHETPDAQAAMASLDWVIIGCESGPKRRWCKPEWVRDLLGQCAAAGVPAFNKQMDIGNRVSHEPDEWTMPFRVRQWPEFLQPKERP